jgi:hypothetical protein
MEDKNCPDCKGTGKKTIQHLTGSFETKCGQCDGTGVPIKVFFTCGVTNCGHVVESPNWIDIQQYDRDKRWMIEHYKEKHTELVCTYFPNKPGQIFSDWYRYDGINDAIGPNLTYGDEVTSWADLCKIEGRA